VESHGALLERTIAAYVESLRWSPAENRVRMRGDPRGQAKIPRDVAERTSTRSPIRFAAFTPDAAASTWKGFEISSLCAPRSKARERETRSPKATSTSLLRARPRDAGEK